MAKLKGSKICELLNVVVIVVIVLLIMITVTIVPAIVEAVSFDPGGAHTLVISLRK